MKIGPNDILREHFGHFFFCHLCDPTTQKKYPRYPETNQYIWVAIKGFGGGGSGKNSENMAMRKMREKCGKMRKNAENAENAEKCGKMRKMWTTMPPYAIPVNSGPHSTNNSGFKKAKCTILGGGNRQGRICLGRLNF